MDRASDVTGRRSLNTSDQPSVIVRDTDTMLDFVSYKCPACSPASANRRTEPALRGRHQPEAN